MYKYLSSQKAKGLLHGTLWGSGESFNLETLGWGEGVCVQTQRAGSQGIQAQKAQEVLDLDLERQPHTGGAFRTWIYYYCHFYQ